MLKLTLTDSDLNDLIISEGTFNTMTEEGVEVVINPSDFKPEQIGNLEGGGTEYAKLEIVGQYNGPVEVEIRT